MVVINFIIKLSKICFEGKAMPLDIMFGEMPEIYYNTSGFMGIFNFKNSTKNKIFNIYNFPEIINKINILKDVWTNEEIKIGLDGIIEIPNMPPRSSRLFEIIPIRE